MKRSLLFLFIAISWIGINELNAQCTPNTRTGTFCNTRSNFFDAQYNADQGCGNYRVITNYSPGEYFRMPVLAGGCYTVQTCGNSIDTQIMGFQGNQTTNPFVYNDDNGPICGGTQASVNFVPTFTDYTRVDIRQFNCRPGATSSITVRIRQNNNLSFTSSSADMCEGQSRSLTATPARTTVTPLTGSGNRGTFTGTGVSGTTFIAPTPGGASQVYTLTYTFGYCIRTQSIRVWRQPTVSNAGNDQAICSSTNGATLAANTPAIGTGQWTVISGSGSFTNPNDPNTTVTGLSNGNNVFRWTITNGPCTQSTDDVSVNFTLDNIAPVAPSLSRVVVDCNGSLSAPSATDNCAGTVIGTTSDALSYVEGDSTFITWSFNDGNGNISTASQYYVYDDASAPVAPTLSPLTVDCNGTLVVPSASDNCAGTVLGTTTDTLAFVEGGSQTITWDFDDGNGNVSSATQTYNFDDVTPPLIPSLTSQTVDCNGSLVVPTATDDCAGTITGTTSDVLVFVEGGSQTVTWTFDDGNGNTSSTTEVYNFDDATAPVAPTLPSKTVGCLHVPVAPTAPDNCAGTITGTTTDVLAFVEGGSQTITWSFDDGNGNISTSTETYNFDDTAPPMAPTLSAITVDCNGGLVIPTAFDNCAGNISGTTTDTLNFVEGGSQTVTWTFDDGNGNTSSSTQVYNFDDDTPPPPVTLANATVDCNGSLSTPPSSMDDCAGLIIATTTDTLNYVEGGSTIVTWTFDDGNGNTSTSTQTYFYDDIIAPSAPTLSARTVDCNGTLSAPSATDNCAGTVSGTTSDVLAFVEGGSQTVTWTFNDGNGNTSTSTEVYNFDDVTAPVAPTLSSLTVDCNAVLIAPTATDDCAGTITATTSDVLNFVEGGSQTVTWTFDDGNGNSTTRTQLFNFDDVTAPTPVTLADVTIDCNGSLAVPPSSLDDCAGLIIATTSDTLNFVDGSSTTVTWIFDDGNGNTSSSTQTYFYDDVIAPVAPTLSAKTIDCNGGLIVPFALDNCSDTVLGTTGDVLTYVEGGSQTVTWTFDDGNGNTSTSTETYNFEDNTAPVAPTLSAKTVDCNGVLSAPSAMDNCAGMITGTTTDVLNFVEGGSQTVTWTFNDGNGNSSTASEVYNFDDVTAPPPVTLNDVTIDCNGSLSTPPSTTDDCAGLVIATTNDVLNFVEGGSTTVTWTFDDGNGNTSTSTQIYYYDDVTAPTAPSLSALTFDCGDSLIAPTAMDDCAGMISGTTTDVLSFVDGGSQMITWTFDDGNGNSSTSTQMINFDDVTPPMMPSLANVSIDCQGGLMSPFTIDNCADTVFGTTSTTLNYVEGDSTLVTWTFDDGNGNSITADQWYVYEDLSAPTAPSLTNVTVDCNGTLSAPIAMDNCSGMITGTTTDVLNFIEGDSTLITWTFVDNNGNSSTASQYYVYDDVTAPNAPSLSALTVDCNGTLTVPTAMDDCAGMISGTTTDVLNFVEGGFTVITWSFDDGNGNVSTSTQMYNYDDTTSVVPPTLANVTVDCNGTLTPPTAMDDCAGMITATTTDVLNFVQGGSTLITWNFDDGNGNTSSTTQTYDYDDVTAPVPDVANLADVTGLCEVNTLNTPSATDDCAPSVSVTNDAVLPITTVGTTVVTWTYDDGNGNTSTQTQNVVISGYSVTASLVSGTTMEADQTGDTYQWIDCSNNQAIAGATNQSYTATANGDYAVIVTDGNCRDTSNCINITGVSLASNRVMTHVDIYPNPTRDGRFTISTEMEIVEVQLFDLLGNKLNSDIRINESNLIDASLLPASEYVLRVITKDGVSVHKIVISK